MQPVHAAAAVAVLVFAATPVGATFGGGPTTFAEYEIPGGIDAPEPTIGIPWNTDHVFYHAGTTTFRATFDADDAVTWDDVTPPYQVPINLDPLLVADEDTGRIFAGGLHGPCSVMMFSDDDGETWLPTLNMCSGAQFDHQSLGIGPKPVIGNPLDLPSLQNAYYCGQLALIGCSVSLDGGVTWTPPTPAVIAFAGPGGDQSLGCGGFHGHWRVSRVTGTAFLPVGDCGSLHGMLTPHVLDVEGTQGAGLTGLTFTARWVEDSHPWDGGFDPSIGIGRGAGWLYYGQADHMGARIALTKDEGASWAPIGGGMGVTAQAWLDVGQFADPPVVKATFADVQAGDDDRVAFTFLGLEDLDGDGAGDEYGDLYECDEPEGGENRVWHYFAAFSYDAGETWAVHKITGHPVQIGGIWDGGGGDPCRNLLDFNDMDIDSHGRVHISWADGCIDVCYEPGEGDGEHSYTQVGKLFRQTGGRGLFAAFDVDVPDAVLDSDDDGVPDDEDRTPFGEEEAEDSTLGVAVAFCALLAALLAARRRR
jgi:hypothetical protein